MKNHQLCWWIFIFFINKTLKKKETILDEVKLQENTIKNDGFALMLQQEDGTYKESESSSWPTNMYFNSELSGCMDTNGNKIENSLSFDSATNLITIKTNQTTYCYVYFDKSSGESIVVKVSTDGVENTLPSYNKYKQELICNGADAYFSTKYQRIEISQVNKKSTTCTLNYTKDTTSYTLLKDKVESVNTTNNNGYRYSGKQPDNWVWFNNELWRIIGSIPTTLSDKRVENRVKIIRAESIGILAYDGDGSSQSWGENTLYDVLNNYYYGKKDITGESPCLGDSGNIYTLCNYTNKGISNDSNDYYGRMILDVYMNVGSTNNTETIAQAYTSETGTLTSNTVKIGLMNISDYGYAISGISYDNGLKNMKSYLQNNWLQGQGSEWTMTTYASNYVHKVSNLGGDSLGDWDADICQVRPVVYLNSNVYIISGDGTENNPYILGM